MRTTLVARPRLFFYAMPRLQLNLLPSPLSRKEHLPPRHSLDRKSQSMADSTPLPDAITQSILTHRKDDAIILVLARHGQPGPPRRSGDVPEGFGGHPLTPLGHRQARLLGKRLAKLPVDHIYCSTLARSYQTAMAVHAHHPQIPLEIRPDLIEVEVFHNAYVAPTRKKALRLQMEKDRAAVAGFLRHLNRTHKPGQIVAAALHGNLNNLLMTMLLDLPYRTFYISQNHTCVNVLILRPPARAQLGIANCTMHLPASMIGTPNISAQALQRDLQNEKDQPKKRRLVRM